MCETPPRDGIVGSRLTDYIHLGRARPWSNKIDFIHCLCMTFMLTVSFIKAGLMLKGHLFLTLNDTLP